MGSPIGQSAEFAVVKVPELTLRLIQGSLWRLEELQRPTSCRESSVSDSESSWLAEAEASSSSSSSGGRSDQQCEKVSAGKSPKGGSNALWSCFR